MKKLKFINLDNLPLPLSLKIGEIYEGVDLNIWKETQLTQYDIDNDDEKFYAVNNKMYLKWRFIDVTRELKIKKILE